MRIVTESIASPWIIDDQALNRPMRSGQDSFGPGQGNRASEPRSAFFRRHISELSDEFLVVGGIVTMTARETSRVYSGRAAESVNLQARIVGQGPQARQPRIVHRFALGVARKGFRIFHRIGQVGELVESCKNDGQPGKNVLNFA